MGNCIILVSAYWPTSLTVVFFSITLTYYNCFSEMGFPFAIVVGCYGSCFDCVWWLVIVIVLGCVKVLLVIFRCFSWLPFQAKQLVKRSQCCFLVDVALQLHHYSIMLFINSQFWFIKFSLHNICDMRWIKEHCIYQNVLCIETEERDTLHIKSTKQGIAD